MIKNEERPPLRKHTQNKASSIKTNQSADSIISRKGKLWQANNAELCL
jgi:hypothetical protein